MNKFNPTLTINHLKAKRWQALYEKQAVLNEKDRNALEMKLLDAKRQVEIILSEKEMIQSKSLAGEKELDDLTQLYKATKGSVSMPSLILNISLFILDFFLFYDK